MAFLPYKNQDPTTILPAPTTATSAWTPELQKQLTAYQSGQTSGIPNELYQYAQNNPSMGIDRSGQNLSPTDSMFGFYNPQLGQNPSSWYPTDDRNNTNLLNAAMSTPTTTTKDYSTDNSGFVSRNPYTQTSSYGWASPSYADTSSPATTTTNTSYGSIPSGGVIRVRMPDNSERVFTSLTPELDAALKAGGRPVRSDNTLASLTTLNGGWLADNMPLNQFMGGELSAAQKAALTQAGLLPMNINTTGNTSERIPGLMDAAVQTGQGGAAALASGVLPQYQALLNFFMNLAGTDANTRDSLLNGQLGLTNDALNFFNSRRDTGLSPEAKAAMTTQAMESVPAQFARLKSDLATRLLRDSGGLPRGGDFLRGYGPLLAQEAATKAGLLQNVTLQDEEARQKSREMALQAAGLSGNLVGTIANAYDPARYTSGLLGGAGGLLNTTNSMTSSQFQGLDLATKLTAIGSENEMGSKFLPVLASLISAGMVGGKDSLISKGIDALVNIFTGKKSDPNKPGNSLFDAGGGFTIPGGDIWDGLKDIVGDVAGGIGTALSTATKFLASNPWTIGIAGAVAGVTVWMKSQAHWEANTMVQNFENPFHREYLAPFVSQFNSALGSGKMTKDQAQSAKDAFLATWELYKQKAREFGTKGSDEKTVSEQSINNLQTVAITPILASIDAAIASLS